MSLSSTPPCLCGSGLPAEHCCVPLLTGRKRAETAKQLMRSRYCAYVQHDEGYLRKSWHPDSCPLQIEFDDSIKWLGLKILSTRDGEAGENSGQVEFVARYKINGRAFRLHENSRFERYRGEWVYVEGDVRE